MSSESNRLSLLLFTLLLALGGWVWNTTYTAFGASLERNTASIAEVSTRVTRIEAYSDKDKEQLERIEKKLNELFRLVYNKNDQRPRRRSQER